MKLNIAVGVALALLSACAATPPAPREVSPGEYFMWSGKKGKTPDMAGMADAMTRANDFCSRTPGKTIEIILTGNATADIATFKCVDAPTKGA